MAGRQTSVTDDLELLLAVMPSHLRRTLEARPQLESLLEVVLDLGRPPEARFPGTGETLADAPVSREDLQHVVERVGRFGKDNRAGIERTLHRISALRNRQGEVVGLTCRVGRAVVGTVDIVRDTIEAGDSILLLGRPGVGKTTLLREAARVLADELGHRVIVVDTSNEIAGDGDIPHPGIGRARRMQVPSPEQQHAVMIEAVENHMPEVIVIDEIGTEAEALAARTIAERGVQLIATAHGNTLENLLQNPTLSDLVGGVQAVILSDEEARRRATQKTVLERRAPPTFDVVIEIQEKDSLAVHHRVGDVVDRLLRGLQPRPVPLPEGRSLRIFPYAVSRSKLDRAIRDLGVPAAIVSRLEEADLVLTLKSQERRQPRRLRDADGQTPVHVVKSNTVTQLESFLRAQFGVPGGGADFGDREAAMREVEEAVAEVIDRAQPAELQPRKTYLRRLQHQLVQRYGLHSGSLGEEPYRRVVIYPR